MNRYLILVLAGLLNTAAWADTFSPDEMFQIPFGSARETLGAKAEKGQFSFPREFTLDTSGRIYVYDTYKHRIARFSTGGRYEIGFGYPPTARQIFAHADAQDNLWLLVTEPHRGLYYGVYDSSGNKRRDGIFAKFNRYRLHIDPHSTLQIILSSDKGSVLPQTYIFHEPSLLMKKIDVPPPPEKHHEVRRNNRIFYVDAIPGAASDAAHVYRVTDPKNNGVAEIKGRVIYVTDQGEIYTRLSERELQIYAVDGTRLGTFTCPGLASSCAALRFDGQGNLYQLDGIPNDQGEYTPQMPGMRLIRWRRTPQ